MQVDWKECDIEPRTVLSKSGVRMNRSYGLLLCAGLACLTTAGAKAQPFRQDQVTQAHPVCLIKADAYQLAIADVAGTSGKLWKELVAKGKCAMVPATYLFTLDTY